MSSTTVVDHSSKSKSIKDIDNGRGIIIPFYPWLAEQIGVGDTLLLVQIEYWINHLRVKVEEFEGVKWLNLSAQEMIARGFQHLDRRNINRTITRLIERGLLRVAYLPGSHTKWLTVDYEMIERLDTAQDRGETPQTQQIPQERGKMLQVEAKRSKQVAQNAPVSEAKRPATPLYIKDLEDQGKDEGEDHGAAETPRVNEHPVVSPPNYPTSEKEIFSNQPTTDPKLEKMIEAIAEACQMNLKLSWHREKINPVAQELLSAGYTWFHVAKHGYWWRMNDWRGKKGDIPRLRELADTLNQSSPHVGASFYHMPDDDKLAELKRAADPDCKYCSGFGWNDSCDPDSILWGTCICTDTVWQQRKLKGAHRSTPLQEPIMNR